MNIRLYFSKKICFFIFFAFFCINNVYTFFNLKKLNYKTKKIFNKRSVKYGLIPIFSFFILYKAVDKYLIY